MTHQIAQLIYTLVDDEHVLTQLTTLTVVVLIFLCFQTRALQTYVWKEMLPSFCRFLSIMMHCR